MSQRKYISGEERRRRAVSVCDSMSATAPVVVPQKKRLTDAERRRRAENLRRLNTEPTFRARKADGARARYAGDPEFKKAAQERMKKLNADPDFVARREERLKAGWKPKSALPVERRDAIIAALTLNPNALQVARQHGVSDWTVRKFAKMAGIALKRGGDRG